MVKGPSPGRYEAFTRLLMRACWLVKVGADMVLWSGARGAGVVPTV